MTWWISYLTADGGCTRYQAWMLTMELVAALAALVILTPAVWQTFKGR